jgi:hypothetical protein
VWWTFSFTALNTECSYITFELMQFQGCFWVLDILIIPPWSSWMNPAGVDASSKKQ